MTYYTHGPYDRLGAANILICPSCQMRCDVFATVCPHCTRDIPEADRMVASREDVEAIEVALLKSFILPILTVMAFFGIAMFKVVWAIPSWSWYETDVINPLTNHLFSFVGLFVIPKFIADWLHAGTGWGRLTFMVPYWVIVAIIFKR